MKIKSIYIASFGGLKDKQINLNGNFNIIYGDNENGKTTIINFIKMMFYGTERSSSQISKNLRKKYTPWDNSCMAGSIDFEVNNRNYRLERTFGSSNSTDKVTLIDLDLSTRENISADIGVKLFGLSYGAFERSVFVGQFGFPESNTIAEGEINSKLSNLTLTGDQTVSFEEVNKRLENAKNNLTTKRSVGIYDKNIDKYKELNRRLETAKQSQKTLSEKQETAKQIQQSIENLQNRCRELKTKIDSEQDFRNAEKLKELLYLKEKLDNLNQTLTLSDGKIIDEMFLRKIEFCLSKIEACEQKISSKQNEIKLLQNNLELALNPSPDMTPEKAAELTERISKLEKENSEAEQKIAMLESIKKPKSTAFIITLVIGLMLLGLGAVAGIIPIICGLVSIITSIVMIVNSKNKFSANKQTVLDLKLKQNQLISVIATEKANLNAVNTAINSNTTIIEKQKELLKNSQSELLSFEGEIETNTTSLIELYSPFKNTSDIEQIISSLEEIRKNAQIQKEIKQNINYILKDVGNISYDDARLKLEKLQSPDSNIDFDKLKLEQEINNKQLTEYASNLATLNAEIKAVKENISNIDALKSKLTSLQETINKQKNYCDALDITSSVLADSFAEVRRSFGSVLEQKASEIFKGITGNKYNGMSISKSFEITVEKADTFGGKEIDYLSSGTADQAYLSLRLAICELMSQNDSRLPVLLDDTLAQYDDTRTSIALKYLKEYSNDGQIILFTCHNSILNSTDANRIIL